MRILFYYFTMMPPKRGPDSEHKIHPQKCEGPWWSSPFFGTHFLTQKRTRFWNPLFGSGVEARLPLYSVNATGSGRNESLMIGKIRAI